MGEFPIELDRALANLSKEFGLGLTQNDHYDSVNRQLGWFRRNERIRIDFEFDGRRIEVFLLTDKFPFSPRFLIWCHNYIPMCKLFAKIEWKSLGELQPDETQEFYLHKIRGFIQKAEEKASDSNS